MTIIPSGSPGNYIASTLYDLDLYTGKEQQITKSFWIYGQNGGPRSLLGGTQTLVKYMIHAVFLYSDAQKHL